MPVTIQRFDACPRQDILSRFCEQSPRSRFHELPKASVVTTRALGRGVAVCLFISILLVSGCSSGGGAANIGSVSSPAASSAGNSSSSSSSPANSPGLIANPSAIAFGEVATGAVSTQSVTIANPGASALSVSGVSISGAGFSAEGVPTGLILPPGQTATLSIQFAPAGSGGVTGSATVGEASSNGSVTISLSGMGITAVAHTLMLTWFASPSDVASYQIYRSGTALGPYSFQGLVPGSQLQWIDGNVEPGTTYFYVVTAAAGDNTESVFSNQAFAAVPHS